jgi:hypothetical protein
MKKMTKRPGTESEYVVSSINYGISEAIKRRKQRKKEKSFS